jgi:hypothetical protein
MRRPGIGGAKVRILHIGRLADVRRHPLAQAGTTHKYEVSMYADQRAIP